MSICLYVIVLRLGLKEEEGNQRSSTHNSFSFRIKFSLRTNCSTTLLMEHWQSRSQAVQFRSRFESFSKIKQTKRTKHRKVQINCSLYVGSDGFPLHLVSLHLETEAFSCSYCMFFQKKFRKFQRGAKLNTSFEMKTWKSCRSGA